MSNETIRERFRTLLDQTDGDASRAAQGFFRQVPSADLDTDEEIQALVAHRMATMEGTGEAEIVFPTFFDAALEARSVGADLPDVPDRFARFHERLDPRENPGFSEGIAAETRAAIWSALKALLADEYAAWRARRGLSPPE